MKTYKKAAKIFKALSSPIRINILMLLMEREHCACEFPHLLNISQPNSSRNLSVLKNAGLIESYRDGKKIIYYINNPEIKELIEIAKKIN
ncbi:MAG TPA: metalloregulator ArsR/SmtB family transcription factor [Caldisericia bacterium]|nr:metalloregulator ArsR/SmtB family transcription factor [Caldisericia bacterium]HPO28671.1 metalloregulator ArsR/SmtB family transcription factor [Caldisericia bacterium]HQG82381.1 metalloregulator ArsR/SmtB family transcription factor [Caldisericia bacterium]